MLRALHAEADPSRRVTLQRFFRTGPGDYGEGDRFIGVTVPSLRKLARRVKDASLADIDGLLRSPIHEAPFLALLLLVQAFPRRRRAGSAEDLFSVSWSHAIYQ
jgi:hypothetical protein